MCAGVVLQGHGAMCVLVWHAYLYQRRCKEEEIQQTQGPLDNLIILFFALYIEHLKAHYEVAFDVMCVTAPTDQYALL